MRRESSCVTRSCMGLGPYDGDDFHEDDEGNTHGNGWAQEHLRCREASTPNRAGHAGSRSRVKQATLSRSGKPSDAWASRPIRQPVQAGHAALMGTQAMLISWIIYNARSRLPFPLALPSRQEQRASPFPPAPASPGLMDATASPPADAWRPRRTVHALFATITFPS